MNDILGTEPAAFVGMTVILFGLAAALTGRALAQGWRPAWQVIPAALLLTVADCFLHYALFEAPFGSLGGFFSALAVLGLIMTLAYLHAHARKMVRQYPWLYEPSGPLGWRLKRPDGAG